MKKNLKLILAPLFLSLLMITTTWAAEQQPIDTPPQMEDLNEGEPAVTSAKKETRQQTEQTSQVGNQTEVRVTNEIGTYIVQPNQTIGTSLPGDAQSSSNNPVQWIVKSWGGSKNTDPATANPPTLPNNPDNQTGPDAQ